MQTSRGIGLAIRLLASFQATLERLNLHPDLKRLIAPANGLVIISGPTGSGKSSTLAALIQEINLTEARHIVTIESPVEYTFRPRRAFIRQRRTFGWIDPVNGWLVVDARPDPDSVEYDGATGYWRPLVQLRDAAFSLSPTPTQSIYFTDWDTESPTVVGESIAPGKPAAAWFNDAWTYWLAQTPLVGAKLPANLGVRLKVKSATSTGMTIWVDNVK